jgi:hypothetical protein
MAYPDDIYVQRDLENLPGLEFDPNNKKTLFAEDILGIGQEIIDIENYLQERIGTPYVVEQASGTNFLWRKYSDKKFEIWQTQTVTKTISTAWQGMRISSEIPAISYPFTVKSIINRQQSVECTSYNYNVWLLTTLASSLENTGSFRLISPENITASASYKLSYYALGAY